MKEGDAGETLHVVWEEISELRGLETTEMDSI